MKAVGDCDAHGLFDYMLLVLPTRPWGIIHGLVARKPVYGP